MLLFQSWYERLPGWGTLLLVALIGFLTWSRERGWKTVADQRKERIVELEADAKNDLEKTLAKEKKYQDQILALTKENTQLHERTDLEPLAEQLKKLNELIDGWKLEGRARFDKADAHLIANEARIAVIHQEQTAAMAEVVKELKDVRVLFAEHMQSDQFNHAEDLEQKKSITSILGDLEVRSRANTQLYSELAKNLPENRRERQGKSGQRQERPGGK